MRVDLPAPFGTDQRGDPARGHGDVHAVEHGEPPEPLPEPVELDRAPAAGR